MGRQLLSARAIDFGGGGLQNRLTMTARRFPPPLSVEELDNLLVANEGGSALYFLPHQSNMPPMRPPVSNAFFCLVSRLS